MGKNVVIVGGHGKVGLRLTRILASSGAGHNITSIIRDASQIPAIREAGGTPLVLSIEESTPQDFTKAFTDAKADVVYFTAGAGGKAAAPGGDAGERAKKVDWEGAVKVFDAIEGVGEEKSARPRLVVVSGVDVRRDDLIPAHYTEADKAISVRVRAAIPTWFKYKYLADKELVSRGTDKFDWTLVRPGGLSDKPGVGKVDIGRTTITKVVSRDDVAAVLAALVDGEDEVVKGLSGLAFDLVGAGPAMKGRRLEGRRD